MKGRGRKNEPNEAVMSLTAFSAMLDIHGASMRRWPAEKRGSAQALLTRSAEARDALRQAAALDALLDGMPAPDVDEARVALVVAGALEALPVPGLAGAGNRKRPFAASGWDRLVEFLGGLLPSPAWSRAAGLATCTASGILVGMLAPLPATSADAGSAGAALHVVDNGIDSGETDIANAVLSQTTLESLFQ